MSIVDIQLVCAMGPPGGGRNPVTNRFVRHFNMLSFAELEDTSMSQIFSTIVNAYMADSPQELGRILAPLVAASIDVYGTITRELRLHTVQVAPYVQLARCQQGVPGAVRGSQGACQARRSHSAVDSRAHGRFRDRLVDEPDREWFRKLMADKMQQHF